MVSIIIPVYNVEQYLVKCIESVINQTYKDIEIILVDDGSKDNSGEICDEYANKDKRIHVIHKENGGVSSARNVGLYIAQGEYISFIDSDDWVEPDFIEVLLKSLKNYDADISQCGFVEETIENESIAYRGEKIVVVDGKEAIKNLYDRKTYVNTVVMWNKIYKKKIFEEIRFEEGIVHEDEALIHEILYKADKVVINESKLHHYLTRSNSIMNSEFNLKRLDSIYAYEKRISFFREKKEYELLSMTMRMYFRVLIGMGTSLFYSSIENKQYYLSEIKEKLQDNLENFNKNKYMRNVDFILLFCYKINPKLGFHVNKSLVRFKNALNLN